MSHRGLARWQLFFYTKSSLMLVAHLQLGQKACEPCSTLLGTFPQVICCWLILCLFVSVSSFGQSRTASQSFESLAKRAAEARDSDRLEEALSLYKRALALRPGWAEGWWSLGTLWYDSNN